MASNDYYQQNYASDQHRYTPYSQDSQPHNVQNAPPRYPSPYGPPQPNTYTDDIPLQNHHRVDTTRLPPPIDTAYPPSPESQQMKPALLESPRSRKSKRKKGFFSGKTPWFVYTFTLIQISVFIGEIIKNSIVTGSPIMIHPSFNPMVGPSTYILINMGARFVPCMRTTYFPGTNTPYPTTGWPCPRSTTNDPSSPENQCTLAELCGLGGLNPDSPNQWYRFIVPMFLHAGIIHIGFNMLLQMLIGRDMEKAIGTIRFAIVYISSGIFGFVLGGNFAAPAIASTGASGSLFGILALVLLDLFYTWKERESPVKDLIWLLFDIIISFVLGLLPGLDNFSHIGGFLMGLGLGICILHSPNSLRKRLGKTRHKTSYSQVGSDVNVALASGALAEDGKKSSTIVTTATAKPVDLSKFAKEPVGFFKGRKPAWWAWWLIRVGCLIGVLVGFFILLSNFYKYRDDCDWCKYLSCLDITVGGTNWCNIGYLTFTNTTSDSSGNTRRGLAALMEGPLNLH